MCANRGGDKRARNRSLVPWQVLHRCTRGVRESVSLSEGRGRPLPPPFHPDHTAGVCIEV